jgi:Lrp/AsnC family transcriptional regulator for asnA, asnC and gidA
LTQYYMDDIDKKILDILQKDARLPYSRIAKMLNLSESTIHMRLKRLRDQGILRGFIADIDPERAGKSIMAFVLIKAEPKRYENVLKVIGQMKEVYELYDVTGEYYALAKVRVSNREELAKVLDDIGHIEGIISTYTMFTLRIIKESKTLEFS